MADLDARIREDLNDDCAIPCAGSDHVAYVNYLVMVDALRAVLDKIADAEEFGDDVDLDDIRTVIARALGVK